MQGPSRPFESLDWYREARQRHYDEEHPWLSRLRSFSAVRGHISLFALGSVVLLAANLVRSPDNVRADTWIVIWGLILIMHAVVTGIASLALQLVAGDEALRPASEVRWDPMRTWRLPAAEPGAPVVGPIPMVSNQPAVPHQNQQQGEVQSSDDETAGPSISSGWRTAEPEEPQTPAPEERASWEEAAAAAWLARRRGSGQDDEAPAAASDADVGATASDDGSDDGLADHELHTRHPL